MQRKKSYVYGIIDPRDGMPFYVGMGSGRRAWYHLGETLHTTENPSKYAIIQDIRAEGLEPIIRIVTPMMMPQDAGRIETALIKKLGRRGFEEYGILTNKNVYGKYVDCSGSIVSEEDLRSLSVRDISNKYGLSYRSIYHIRPRKNKRLTQDERNKISVSNESASCLAARYGVTTDTICAVRGRLSSRLPKDAIEGLKNGILSPREAAARYGVTISAASKHSPYGHMRWWLTENLRDKIKSDVGDILSLSQKYSLSWDRVKLIRNGLYDNKILPNRLET